MLRYINMQFLTPKIQYELFKLANKITVKIIVNYYLFNFENNFWPSNVSKYISDMIANEF